MPKKSDPWWVIDAGLPNGREGERRGRVQAPTEEEAREHYLANPAREGWVIFSIEPGEAPESPQPIE